MFHKRIVPDGRLGVMTRFKGHLRNHDYLKLTAHSELTRLYGEYGLSEYTTPALLDKVACENLAVILMLIFVPDRG